MIIGDIIAVDTAVGSSYMKAFIEKYEAGQVVLEHAH